MHHRVLLFMADGTETCEALLVVDLLRRAGLDVKTVSIHDEPSVRSAQGIRIQTDWFFDGMPPSAETADLLVLPGGMPGVRNLGAHAGLSDLVDQFAASGRPVAAICAAPSILGARGLLDGLTVTAAPSFRDQLGTAVYTGRPVEIAADGRIITGKGLGASIPFALKLIEVLLDRSAAEQVAARICFDGPF